MPCKPTIIKLFLPVFFFLFIGLSKLAAQPDYSTYSISLLTYSPGEELYSSFGHSSLRVKHVGEEVDWVFNYGTFDFDDPKFYFGFISGNLYYRLSRMPFSYVMAELNATNRSLVESPLLLSAEEKTRLIQYLEVNYLPENREYLYDFLFNNCATKLVELIDFATRNKTVYNPIITPDISFRKLLDPYFESRPWLDMGVDLLLGLPVDRKVMGTEAGFLPDDLHLIVKNARIAKMDGTSSILSGADRLLIQSTIKSQEKDIQPSWILWPMVLILLISVIFDSYFSVIFNYLYKLVFCVSAVLGSIIVLLWLLTNHYIFNFNLDLLWANPLLLLLLFFRGEINSSGKRQLYSVLLFVLACMVTLGAISAIAIERNPNLSAIACIVLLGLLVRLKKNREKVSDPFAKL